MCEFDDFIEEFTTASYIVALFELFSSRYLVQVSEKESVSDQKASSMQFAQSHSLACNEVHESVTYNYRQRINASLPTRDTKNVQYLKVKSLILSLIVRNLNAHSATYFIVKNQYVTYRETQTQVTLFKNIFQSWMFLSYQRGERQQVM